MSDPAKEKDESEWEPAAIRGDPFDGPQPFDGPHRADDGEEAALGDRRRRRRRKWRDVANTRPMRHMDADVYSTKKTVAQGFMDVALLSANADQLRTLVTTGDSSSPFHTVCVVFLSLSIALQVVIAVCLMLKGRYNINKPQQFRSAEIVNNVCMVASVFLTAFNVLASAFMTEVPAATAAAAAGEAGGSVLQAFQG